jgi:hypothetical protein
MLLSKKETKGQDTSYTTSSPLYTLFYIIRQKQV